MAYHKTIPNEDTLKGQTFYNKLNNLKGWYSSQWPELVRTLIPYCFETEPDLTEQYNIIYIMHNFVVNT